MQLHVQVGGILNLNEFLMIASSLDYSFLMISLENKINLDSKICVIIIKTQLYCQTMFAQLFGLQKGKKKLSTQYPEDTNITNLWYLKILFQQNLTV